LTATPVPGDTLIWLDGAEASALPLPDRGLDFGDGVFETLLTRRGEPLYLNLHLARMLRGCKVLALPDCENSIRSHLQAVTSAIAARGWPLASLRITLSRGGGPRGYAPPAKSRPRVIISVTRLDKKDPEMATPAALHLADVRWATQPALAGLKHLNRLEQVLAAAEYSEAGLDEAVMLDQNGQVISVVAGNLFVVMGDEILTPGLEHCGIRGTRRDLVMRCWAPELGLAVRECELSIRQLEEADEVFYSNSIVGLRPVASFGGRCWPTHATCDALYRQYRKALA
jgi:4-amino-4-deoxychorismate lyase